MELKNKYKRYEELLNLNGVSGHERQVRSFVKKEMSKYTNEIIQDKLGGVFGVLKGNGPKIMIAGHMDEVGAMVVGITDEGFIKMASVGGINPEVMVSQYMNITISDDKVIRGIVGSIPPHLTRGTQLPLKPISFDDLRLDIGANSKDHAIKLGVKLGQQITFLNDFFVTEDGKKLVSKAFDDRFGCAMALDILEEASKIDHPNTIICGCTVQEEVGLRGGQTASQMIQPDLFLAIDVSPACDFLSEDNNKRQGDLGKGFLLRFHDPRCLMHNGLKDYLVNLSKNCDINYQYYNSQGGTDAAIAQYSGKNLATTIGLPGRYIHSTAAMVHVDDIESIRSILLAIIKDFDYSKLEMVNINV